MYENVKSVAGKYVKIAYCSASCSSERLPKEINK